jgi:hypothetical protein
MGQLRYGRQIHAAQQRVAGQLHDHGSRLQSLQGGIHRVQVAALQQLAAVEYHLRLLEHIHIGESQL